jgi:release factor glutamine methyltransferase
MSGAHYLASEDSALLRKALQGYSGERCLEIGAGNGGNLLELSKRFRLVVGTDLVRPSMSDWREAGANFILADCASCLRDSVFDLVAFNPPYIVGDVENDAAVEGGRNLEVPKSFLLEGLRAVRRGGSIVFLLNDDANTEEFRHICSGMGFELERTVSEREFFEELTVYLARAKG